MSLEMLSGPDLGGGYLHQLTLDRSTTPPVFAYHAQDGGADASGPPIGSLEPFGFEHPSTPCQFGGRRCFHRSFALPVAEAARVRLAYNRHRFVLDASLRQRYAQAAVPVGASLGEFLDRVQGPITQDGEPFFIGGSTAAWVRGVPVQPNDVDVGVSLEGARRIGALIPEYLIEPVAPTTWPLVGAVLGGRAFVGTLANGMRVEWAAREPIDGRPSIDPEFGSDPRSVRLETVPWEGRQVPVARFEYFLVRCAAHGDRGRIRAAMPLARPIGLDRSFLEGLMDQAKIPGPERAFVRSQMVRVPADP